MKLKLYRLILCLFISGARPLTVPEPSAGSDKMETVSQEHKAAQSQSEAQGQQAPVLVKKSSLETALIDEGSKRQKVVQETRPHSLIYETQTKPLPSLTDLANDKETLLRFKNLAALRLELNLHALPRPQALQALIRAIRLTGFQTELVLSVDPIKATHSDRPDQTGAQLKDFQDWLQALDKPAGLDLIAISVQDSDLNFVLWQQAYQILSAHNQAPRIGLAFAQIRALLRFQRLQDSLKNPKTPDLYLFQFRQQQHELLKHLNRLKQILPKTAALQLADFAVSPTADEYDQTWSYRFAYFFSKQNNLHPAPARLRDQQQSQSFLPGLLRSDQSMRPAFWLSHIYFHVNRIDLDEHKLTSALFEKLPDPQTQVFKADAVDFVQHFMNTLYKVNPQDSVLVYTPNKDSQLFYDYLKFQTEESLLNSHFARLKEIEILSSPVQDSRQPQTLQIRNRFVTSLGDYRFEQKLSFQQKKQTWQVSNISEPQLSSDFKTYQRIPSKQTIEADFDPQFKVNWQSFQSKQNDPSDLNDQILWFEIENPNQQPLDAQPVSLTHQGNQTVYAPEPIFFEFFKRVSGGERIQGLLSYPSDSKAHYRMQIKAQEPSREGPRIFEVKPEIRSGQQIKLNIHNPLLERLLLPGISLQIKTAQRLHQLLYVLPQALLPLEHKSYLLDLPAGISVQEAQILARGAAFPIIDLEINLDDAFRAEQVGHRLEALAKYSEVLARFGDQLKTKRREGLIYKVVILNAELKGETEALQVLDSQLKRHPSLKFERLYLDLAELFSDRNRPQIAIEMLKRLHQSQHYSLNSWRLLGYLNKQLKHYPQAIQAYQEALKLAPDNTNTLINLGDLQLEIKHFAQAGKYYEQALKHVQIPSLYKQLAYAYQRQDKLAQAIQAYQTYLKFGADPAVYFTIAELYQKQSQWPQAQVWYLKYTSNCRNCRPEAWRELGYIHKKQGHNQAAITSYKHYLSLRQDAKIQQELGNLYLKQGQSAQALYWLKPLALACSCPALNQQVAYLLKHSGQYAAAVTFYQRALRQGSSSAALWRELAYTAQKAGLRSIAIQAFARLQSRKQAQTSDLLALAALYRQNDQNKKALPLLRYLWQTQSSEPNLQAYLASALDAQQTQGVAAFLLKSAQPKSPQSLYLAGRVLREAGYFNQAADYLLLAVRKAPRPIVDYYRQLSLAYQQAGQNESAIFWLEQLQKDCYQRQPLRQSLASSDSASGVWSRK